MASSLACSSHISLSTAGSGIGLSLLLGGMAEKFLFSLLQKAKKLFCALIPKLT
jgi:hypothetical protein